MAWWEAGALARDKTMRSTRQSSSQPTFQRSRFVHFSSISSVFIEKLALPARLSEGPVSSGSLVASCCQDVHYLGVLFTSPSQKLEVERRLKERSTGIHLFGNSETLSVTIAAEFSQWTILVNARNLLIPVLSSLSRVSYFVVSPSCGFYLLVKKPSHVIMLNHHVVLSSSSLFFVALFKEDALLLSSLLRTASSREGKEHSRVEPCRVVEGRVVAMQSLGLKEVD